MQGIWVDKAGIQIMIPKASFYLLKINNLSNISANILKQEILSLGGDAAIARGALSGKVKKTDCLAMGTLAQFSALRNKLKKQPFGLGGLSSEIATTMANYNRNSFLLDLNKFRLSLGKKTAIMGIVNLTPDSFSGDGIYKLSDFRRQPELIVDHVVKMAQEGADIIDFGGESSRPGARALSIKEELDRTIPVIKILAKRIKIPISIDTYKPEVAKAALDNGALMVNDITGLRNIKMAKLVARYKAAVVIMHMQGNPRTMQQNPRYLSLIDDILDYLREAIEFAISAGIDREKIIIDPGIGFGKTLEHNLQILRSLNELKVLGRPILIGTSRKSFIGKVLNLPPEERLFGTLGTIALAVIKGANLVRAHDVREAKQTLKMVDTILRCQ